MKHVHVNTRLLITTVLLVSTIFLHAQINTLGPGATAPDINLKNVDNKTISFNNFPDAKGFIVVFTCNTCPVAKAYEDRIIALDKKFASQGYPLIAINPNDPELSKGDSFEKMQERAKSKSYSFPYLYDQGQVVTNQYGARNTPHLFLVSKTANGNVIEYTGSIDNDADNTNASKTNFLEQAIGDLQQNKKPAIATTKAIGCGVKRKKA